MEQMLRLLHDCGMSMDDVDFINSDGKTMNKLLLEAKPWMTLFIGSSRVAYKLAYNLNSRIKLDVGFDWKILGPDVHEGRNLAVKDNIFSCVFHNEGTPYYFADPLCD
ncbi:hypothetical protein L1987_13428 [Smallanthus sonchifolius]|uniref:Uncharacterized protein n=1 Tax=Smallanthus sonchifolius TaxID=185202 RepID=A0ACB9JHH7_9ASTR|nr:hypothetical protein L1987_13428 [Smallanthus sonchifolius]